jgi:DNA adenine methylase
MNATCLTPPIKWHGGKHYIAKRMVALMRPHTHYVDTHGGGLRVLFAKDPEGVSEVVNDIDGDLTNFWWVLQTEGTFQRFLRRIQATPFSENEWRAAKVRLVNSAMDGDPVSRAVAFFVVCRQSLAARMDTFAPLSRHRTRRGMNEQVAAWLGAIEGLRQIHARLQRVLILNRDAVEVIHQQDGAQTLFYLDPTYLQRTRTARTVYSHEMSPKQHALLLHTTRGCRGKVMISGYRDRMYDYVLRSWNRHDFVLPNHTAGGRNKRRMTECVWCNF